MLDKDTSLAKKIWKLQGIMIASVLTAIGMATSVLVEALLPGGGEGQIITLDFDKYTCGKLELILTV